MISARAQARLREVGWWPGGAQPSHLLRLALVAAGQPAHPAALAFLEEFSGVTIETPLGTLVIGPGETVYLVPDPTGEWCVVGRRGDDAIGLSTGDVIRLGVDVIGPIDVAFDVLLAF